MSPNALAAFIGASVLLAATPGPGVIYIVTRTLAQGRGAGLASVAGVAAGNLGSAVATACGLAALLAASRWAFVVVTGVGALYLAVLGLGLLRRALGGGRAFAPVPGGAVEAPAPVARHRLFVDGAVVALLNPKTALFFAAFLPPFIDTARPALPQALGLGAGFVAIAAGSDAAYAWGAGRVRAALVRAGSRARAAMLGRATRAGQAAAGAVLLALAAVSAWAGVRRATS